MSVSGGVLSAPQQNTVVDIKKKILKNPESVPALLKKAMVAPGDIPNPHWQQNACTACHTASKNASRHNLRQKSVDRVCNTCHEAISEHDYIHVSDIPVPKKMLNRMTKSFRTSVKQNKGKLACTTCHDLPMTCKKDRRHEKRMNSKFFRDGPYKSRTGLCYHCHDVNKYQRVNAHEQIDKNGKIIRKKCLICHSTDKNLLKAKSIDDVKFNLKNDLSKMCWGCHQWKPHPGGSFSFFSGKGGTPNHLVRPSKTMLKRMKEKEQEKGVIFPLEPGTGKVFCGTCHNPHEKGIIKQLAASKGADSKNRLRMQQICSNCHDKD